MKSYEEAIAEAIKIEYNPDTGKLCIVFQILNEKFKKKILETWTKDIEYEIRDYKLYEKE